MRSEQRATMSRWLGMSMMIVCAGAATACGSDDGANKLSVSSGGFVNDSAVVHARVTYPGFDHTFRNPDKSFAVMLPVRARSGSIRIQFVRIKGQADTIGRGEVTLKIKPGNLYGATFMRVPAGYPEQFCFGCTGLLKFPMTGSASGSTDMNYLSYTNTQPLCDGCVY